MERKVEAEEGYGKPGSATYLLQWSQWQLLDSILPTGGFAHSFGLEAAIQARIVTGPEDLKTFLIHVLENTGSLLLPFVYTATKSPNLDMWSKLDKTLEATLTNEVSRKASISQGSSLLRIAASVFLEVPALKEMRASLLGSGSISFHHAPVFGVVCGLLGFDSGTSQRAYMFITMRDVISAATRLNLVGPLGASVLQHQIAHVAEENVKKWMDRPIEEACQTAPILDTVQVHHVAAVSIPGESMEPEVHGNLPLLKVKVSNRFYPLKPMLAAIKWLIAFFWTDKLGLKNVSYMMLAAIKWLIAFFWTDKLGLENVSYMVM